MEAYRLYSKKNYDTQKLLKRHQCNFPLSNLTNSVSETQLCGLLEGQFAEQMLCFIMQEYALLMCYLTDALFTTLLSAEVNFAFPFEIQESKPFF